MGGRGWPVGVLVALVCAVPVVVAVAQESGVSGTERVVSLVPGVVAGWSFMGAGLAIRSAGRIGPLMVLVGLLTLLSGISFFPCRALVVAGNLIGAGVLALFAHLILVVPEGRATERVQRAMIVAAYAGTAAASLGWLWFEHGDGLARRLVLGAGAIFLWGYGLVLAGVLVRRWLVLIPAPRRHTFAGMALAGVPMVLVLGIREGLGIWPGTVLDPGVFAALQVTSLVLMVLWPLGFLAGVLRSRLDRAALAGLAVHGSVSSLEGALAGVLRDPTLRIGYRDAGDGYLDHAGRPVETAARTVRPLEITGRPAVALIHDPALDDEPELVGSAAAIARLTIENERMSGELAARLAEVSASRTRIVEAGDAERRRIERNLHDGAQQRLVHLATLLGRARVNTARGTDAGPALDEAASELQAALAELRELARGLHPPILREAGLGPALASLAERSPVPATVVRTPARRFPEVVEQAAYFVAAEAVTNAARHARASEVLLSAGERDGFLMIEIQDDGIGGAAPAGGSGLGGLADRMAALDGRFTVTSAPETGTRVAAEIPVASVA